METVQLLTLIGVPSLISGLVLTVITRLLNRREAERRSSELETLERVQQMETQNGELEKQSEAIMLGVQALLRDRLLQGYRYFFELGYASYEDRRNLENLYMQYHHLGENGVMDDLRRKFIALPTQSESEE